MPGGVFDRHVKSDYLFGGQNYTITMTRFTVQPGDNAPFHDHYVQLVKDKDIVPYLHAQREVFVHLLNSLPAEKGDYAYAPGKWTIKQMLQHIIDTERVFAFRLLAVSRGEQQNLPGFEQDDYLDATDPHARTLGDMRREFETVRDATLSLVDSITQAQADRTGSVSNHPLAARAMPFIIAGHLDHHLGVLHERYSV